MDEEDDMGDVPRGESGGVYGRDTGMASPSEYTDMTTMEKNERGLSHVLIEGRKDRSHRQT